MLEFENYDNSPNEEYEIPSRILEFPVSQQELDDILDTYIDDKDSVTSEQEQQVVLYCLQLFYKSGRNTTSTDELYEKYNRLIGERVVHHLDQLKVIESLFDGDKGEFVHKLNAYGLKKARELYGQDFLSEG